ncbi:MAG: hypothetical protein GHCLOJNM_02906 [bacterium]|nr:hypothetical protein [bacterium]
MATHSCGGIPSQHLRELQASSKCDLRIAVRNKDVYQALSLLHGSTAVNLPDADGMTALHYAARSGREDVVVALIESGADVGATRSDGTTPLHCTAEEGHIAVMAVLLERGAPIDAVTDQQLYRFHINANMLTPLDLALANGHSSAGAFLIERGATHSQLQSAMSGNEVALQSILASTMVIGYPPRLMAKELLFMAADTNNVRVLCYLLSHGADPTYVDENGWSALHWAALQEHPIPIHLLIQQGAPINGKAEMAHTHTRFTPLKLLTIGPSRVRDEVRACARVLIDAGAEYDLFDLIVADYVGLARELLCEDPGVVNTPDDFGEDYPIHYTAYGGSPEMLRLLLSSGARCDVQDHNGQTAYDISLRTKRNDLASILEDKCGCSLLRENKSTK